MDVCEIVEVWIKENEYDGLYCRDECACKLDDLAPCGEMRGECEAGYIQKGLCGETEDFVIGSDKTV